MTRTHRFLPAGIACAGMFNVGMIFSIQGAILPHLLRELDLSYTVGGIWADQS